MRWLLLLVAACGRIGFDATDTEPDAAVVGRWAKVSTDDSGTCAITLTGELWCWGAGGPGRLGRGAVHLQGIERVGTSTSWTSVSIGTSHSCGLQGDQLWCWGTNNHGQLTGRAAFDVALPYQLPAAWSQIDVSEAHTCAIRSDGQLFCWGEGASNTLGNGSQVDQSIPTAVAAGPSTWKQVATSEITTCAIGGDDSLWCWGFNSTGQVGDGTTMPRLTPVQVDAARKWKSVDVAFFHTCAIDIDGVPYCWGDEYSGENNVGPSQARAPMPVMNMPVALESIDIGRYHSCGRTSDGSVYCWGSSEQGQLGILQQVVLPTKIATASAYNALREQTCIIADARLSCAGRNGRGQVIPPAAELHEPTRADQRTDWQDIVVASRHGCGLVTGDATYCWGENYRGELGNGTSSDIESPVPIGRTYARVAVGSGMAGGIDSAGAMWLGGVSPDQSQYIPAHQQLYAPGFTSRVAFGAEHFCKVAPTNAVVCGGDNAHGQLGNGSFTNAAETAITGSYIDISARENTTCAIDAGGMVACWGDNFYGQVGNGSTADANAPQLINTLTGVTQVALGRTFTCALAGGEIWCWGAGSSGQLGPGSTGSTTPVKVSPRTDWARISAGDEHACAIDTSGALWCWGHGDDGQLGVWSEGVYNSPALVRIGTETTWARVACGDHFTCALKTDGTRWCMGSNNWAELGDGQGWHEQFTVIP
ncbi:MAG TPA: hypothetical protein VMZ53_12015 [Kofleriaceae bacterium]|nr:hypothetical protein [Kofleriaceae bacterium]